MSWEEIFLRFCNIKNSYEEKTKISFYTKTKVKYPSLKAYFEKINSFELKYKERFKSKLLSQKERPKRLLGHNASALLQNLLNRSRYLYRGFIMAFNDGNTIMVYLATRSHFETTGAVACLLKSLRKFYNGYCTYSELDNIVYKLYLGGRAFPDRDLSDYSHAPRSLNALSLIDDVDTLFSQMKGEKSKKFRESYDFLSEFCHPNFLGISQGANVNMPLGDIDFYYPPFIDIDNAKILLSDFSISLTLFIFFFDECYKLLNEKEEMPDFEL